MIEKPCVKCSDGAIIEGLCKGCLELAEWKRQTMPPADIIEYIDRQARWGVETIGGGT